MFVCYQVFICSGGSTAAGSTEGAKASAELVNQRLKEMFRRNVEQVTHRSFLANEALSGSFLVDVLWLLSVQARSASFVWLRIDLHPGNFRVHCQGIVHSLSPCFLTRNPMRVHFCPQLGGLFKLEFEFLSMHWLTFGLAGAIDFR